MEAEHVWIFSGSGGRFASAVFSEKKNAVAWIERHRLSGMLTKYPLNIGVYDWAIAGRSFTPKTAEHASPEFIGRFTSAGQEHYHYEDGLEA